MKKLFFLFLLAMIPGVQKSFSQELFLSPVNPGIYDMIDELSSDHLISLNSIIKPFSRNFVFKSLASSLASDSLLTEIQSQEIREYLKNYSQEMNYFNIHPKDVVYSGNRSSPFKLTPLTINFKSKWISIALYPTIGYEQYINENMSVYSIKAGAGVMAYVLKHFAFSGCIYKQFQNSILVDKNYLVPDQGGNWNRHSNGGGDYVYWSGQITYSWKWGMIGVFKDRMDWGNNYHGANIFSDKPPAFPYIRLKVIPAKWIEFNYIHGWLNSDIPNTISDLTDQGRSADVFSKKYIAANMVTFIPWKNLHISLGNSIIYDGKIQAAYFIPVLFYKSVDHTLSSGIDNENSQMFFDISSRQVKHLHLYLTLFVDEFKASRVTNKNEHNFLSWKGGIHISNLILKNYSFTIEGTRTLPMTYQHYVPTLTFESGGYNFGNYLRDNAQELYLEIKYKPLRLLHLGLSYTFAQHSGYYQYGKVLDGAGVPVLKDINWENHSLALIVNYSILPNLVIFVNYQYRKTKGDVTYTPPLYRGTTNTISFGFQTGF